jgi:hypothetical protein
MSAPGTAFSSARKLWEAKAASLLQPVSGCGRQPRLVTSPAAPKTIKHPREPLNSAGRPVSADERGLA